jgi:hypothetical protein
MAGKRSRRLSEPAAFTAPQTTDGLLALHRVRFLEWRPSAVTAMRAAPDGSVLAVARESGAVEIWETDYWTLVQVSLTICDAVLYTEGDRPPSGSHF